MIQISVRVNDFLNAFFITAHSFDKHPTVFWHFSMLTGSFVCSTSNLSTGYEVLESVPVVFFIFFFSPDHLVSL